MTTFKLIAAAALASTVSLSAVLAADLPSRVAPPPPPPVLPTLAGWEGVYVGSTYGYGWTNFKTSQGVSRSRTESGQTGGAIVGYNFQTGRVVYGAEGSIDLNVIRGNIAGVPGALTTSHLDTLYDMRFRGVLGYDMGWWMPFVAGGAVVNETYQSSVGGSVPYGDVNRRVGWTAGAGVDVKINPSQYLGFLPMNLGSLFGPLIFRAEYIHDSLPRSTYTLGPIPGGRQAFRTESDSNLIRAAIIYRFGDTAPHPYADAIGNVNWGGGYGGIFGAYGNTDTRVRSASLGTRKINGSDGGLGGIYAGTNFMFMNNKLMLGFDGSTAFSDVNGTGTEPGAIGPVKYREYINADIRARIGYAFGRFLPFAAGGVAFTRSEQRDATTGSELGRIPADNWTIGGGLDYRVTERVSVRAEYLYEKSFTNKRTNIDGCPDCKQDRDANIVRFGAAYHFE